MTKLVMRNYWWPGIIKDVGKYVDGCDMCQRIKNRTETLVGKLKLSKISVSQILCKSWTKGLARMVSNGRVHSQ